MSTRCLWNQVYIRLKQLKTFSNSIGFTAIFCINSVIFNMFNKIFKKYFFFLGQIILLFTFVYIWNLAEWAYPKNFRATIYSLCQSFVEWTRTKMSSQKMRKAWKNFKARMKNPTVTKVVVSILDVSFEIVCFLSEVGSVVFVFVQIFVWMKKCWMNLVIVACYVSSIS